MWESLPWFVQLAIEIGAVAFLGWCCLVALGIVFYLLLGESKPTVSVPSQPAPAAKTPVVDPSDHRRLLAQLAALDSQPS